MDFLDAKSIQLLLDFKNSTIVETEWSVGKQYFESSVGDDLGHFYDLKTLQYDFIFRKIWPDKNMTELEHATTVQISIISENRHERW